jgi:prefoldin subunit 5
MREWCIQHTQVLDLAKELRERISDLNQATKAIEHAEETLREAIRVSRRQTRPTVSSGVETRESTLFDTLEGDGGEDWTDDGLSALYALAIREREDLAAQLQTFERLGAQLQKAREDLSAAEGQRAMAARKRSDWDERWEKAIQPLLAFGGVTPESIDTMLNAVDELDRLKRTALQLEAESASLIESTEKFITALQVLVNDCLSGTQVTVSSANASEFVSKLVLKLRKAIRDKQSLHSLSEQHQAVESEIAIIQNQLSAIRP